MLAIPGDAAQIIVSCNYDPTGLEWVDLFDNPALGWLVDEDTSEAVPVVVGTAPPPAADTGAVLSPTWAHFADESLYVPDVWRGQLIDFFTWLATNNGAQRKVRANFRSGRLKTAMEQWGQQNPSLFNPAPF
jgi:hypothetical protein